MSVRPIPCNKIVTGVHLAVRPLRFEFTALDPVHFPPGKAANVLRGAFGTIARQIVEPALYARLFDPQPEGPAPSGLANLPRPFVFRGRHLNGRSFAPGQAFHFHLNLFDLTPAAARAFVQTFDEVARQGLGPTRGRARLTPLPEPLPEPIQLDLSPCAERTQTLRVHFLTPTQLKANAAQATQPEFAPLLARARDRIAHLAARFGPAPLAIDFQGLSQRAADVLLTRCDVRDIAVQRTSSRTGQTHPLGGFTGWAEYQGDLAEFVPYLHAAQWTGVGRQTAFGNGEIRLQTDAGLSVSATTPGSSVPPKYSNDAPPPVEI